MRVLVTGGSGFIGSHVVDRLLAHGHEPKIFDQLPSPHHRRRDVETVTGDLLEPSTLRAALRGCDAVTHLAAVSDVNDVVAQPGRAELVNSRGTALLLEAARAMDVGRVVYASTVWVYGDAEGSAPLDEETRLALPKHLYTATKLAGEMYCRSYGELYGGDHTILRFGIPYGPRSRPTTVLAAFVANALAGKALTIMGDGRQTRQFVYVEDLADGVVASLAPAASGRIYNLVHDESVSVREIAETVRALVGEVPIVHVEDRPADLRSSDISSARASEELGWRATTSFAEGARRYVDWVTATRGKRHAVAASRIAGMAAAVLRQEPVEL
jgi:UDP-glucose 4-epimerase